MKTYDLLSKLFGTPLRRHLLFWLFILVYFSWGYGLSNMNLWPVANAAMHLPFFMLVVYPTLYILIPRLLLKQKYVLFFLSYAALVFGVAQITHLLQDQVCHLNFLKGFCTRLGYNISPLVKVTGMAASIKLIKYYYLKEQEAEREDSGRIQAELELLKSQIHPNFLFNTLNNLLAHTMKRSKESPAIVLKLSDLLRFMIYESRCNFIPLDHEIELLKNFIGLEKLRHEEELDVSFEHSGEIDNKTIRPLLLLPLVENAFKQAAGGQEDQKWISIHLHVAANELQFKVTNSRSEEPNDIGNLSPSHQGIDNVRKRLEMLYPDTHNFTINEYEDMSVLNLQLQLIETDTLGEPMPDRPEAKYDMEMFAG
jgi:sensor histidine kinase YesM